MPLTGCIDMVADGIMGTFEELIWLKWFNQPVPPLLQRILERSHFSHWNVCYFIRRSSFDINTIVSGIPFVLFCELHIWAVLSIYLHKFTFKQTQETNLSPSGGSTFFSGYRFFLVRNEYKDKSETKQIKIINCASQKFSRANKKIVRKY